ncbi:MAG: fructose-1,6-bisphosphatase [Dehalococcoidales bacterium]|nr:fructose-1,6-bisphosphatase [Dehalococcoidales bacterium]
MVKKTKSELIKWDSASPDGELAEIFNSLAAGANQVADLVMHASLSNLMGLTGEINTGGDIVHKLDIASHNIFLDVLKTTGCVNVIGCEESDELIVLDCPKGKKQKYTICMDPIDGSSNIDVAITVGSIFGIWQSPTDDTGDTTSFLRPGDEQVAAVYFIYGSSIVMIIATQNSVNGFTLNPLTKQFMHTHRNIQLPEKGKYYSVNEGNFSTWDQNYQNYVTLLRSKLSARYVGSLVADFHRNLLKGGVFLYPGDVKNKQGKLRLMYEANPLAFIITQAGGSASDGERSILEIQPQNVHQRTPLIIGNTDLVKGFKKTEVKA